MIRQATINDLPSLKRLFPKENAHNSGIAPDSMRKTDDALNRAELEGFIDDESSFLRVYQTEGRIVEVILGTHRSCRFDRWKQKRNYVYLDELTESVNYRGQGIGS